MAIAIVDARRLRAENKARYEELESRCAALLAQCEHERVAQDARRTRVYDDVLVPFRDAFTRLKNVDLADLAEVLMPGAARLPEVDLVDVELSATGLASVLVGGLGSGAGASAAAYATVGAFAAASTGTPIAALSGAAASNATLAFLGGGSLATGGGGIAAGTMVLSGVVTAPVLVAGAAYVTWQGRRARRAQQTVSLELDEADADFAVAEQRVGGVLARSWQVRTMLSDLRAAAVARLPEFVALVDANQDYATYTAAERACVAAMVGLVSATVSLMAAPLADESGAVSDLTEQAVAAAQDRLDDLNGEGPA